MAKVLELKFDAENGKTMTFSINEPKTELTPSEIREAMESIIAANVFHLNGFSLTAINQARLIERNVSDIEF